MRFKDGVILRASIVRDGVETEVVSSPQIQAAWKIAEETSYRVAGREIMITSVLDGKHMVGSKHYIGNAFDMRTWVYKKEIIATLVEELKKDLGVDYDVVSEGDHIHVEYDPK